MSSLSWNVLKRLVIQALLFVSMGIVGWFGFGFLTGAIEEKRDRIQELEVLTENRQQQVALLPDLEKQYDFILANEKKLDIILPKERLVDFIRTLENIAEETKVSVVIASKDNALLESKTTPESKSADPGKVKQSGEDSAPQPKKGQKKETGLMAELPLPNFLRLTVTVTGPYLSIIQYLHKMETLAFALDVVGVQLEESGKENATARVPVALNPFTPSEGSPLPEASTPTPELSLEATFDTILYLNQP